MFKKISSVINYWLPPVFLLCLIFYLSSRPSFAVAQNYWLNFFVFKFLHFCEYAVLFSAFFRALLNDSPVRGERSRALQWAFILTVLWAVSDEWHQHFVPTRGGKVRDVLIDSLGIIFAFYLTKGILPRAPKKIRRLVNKLGI